jgi:hypothetical protein
VRDSIEESSTLCVVLDSADDPTLRRSGRVCPDRVCVVDDRGASGIVTAHGHREAERQDEPDETEERGLEDADRLAQCLGSGRSRLPTNAPSSVVPSTIPKMISPSSRLLTLKTSVSPSCDFGFHWPPDHAPGIGRASGRLFPQGTRADAAGRRPQPVGVRSRRSPRGSSSSRPTKLSPHPNNAIRPADPIRSWMKDDNRTELAAIPIVLVLLGGLFAVMLLAELGTWGWILFGVAALVALALVAAVIGRRHQHPSALDAPATPARRPGDGTFRVLVISDGSATSQGFRDQVVARAAGRALEVLVVAPALGSRLSHWTGDDEARHEAERNLERTVTALAAEGVAARGEVGSDDPIQAADDALREFPADELVFATHSDDHANWKERGVVEIARGRYDLPVAHVAVDPE